MSGLQYKLLEYLNASQICRRTVLQEARGEEKEIPHLKILTAG
jgi:hypothetical protein